MPIRSTMQPLVDRLRRAIGDVADPPTFEDADLQASLDERRVQVSAVALIAESVVTGSATVFRAPFGFWEADTVIASSSGVVDPDTIDPLNGVWQFDAAPGSSLYVTGKAYDLWGTAANLLEEWAARLSLQFDFGTDQQTFNRSDKAKGMLRVAREFGRRALPAGTRGASW